MRILTNKQRSNEIVNDTTVKKYIQEIILIRELWWKYHNERINADALIPNYIAFVNIGNDAGSIEKLVNKFKSRVY
jgi:hypothetical protein